MISFHNQLPYTLEDAEEVKAWLTNLIVKETKKVGEIAYIFCSDEYLLEHNIKFLKHNTLTDIISFDYTIGNILSGDIFISIERVQENAKTFNVFEKDELHRVMAHGLLHYCGYKDKSQEEKALMRNKEDYYLSLRNF